MALATNYEPTRTARPWAFPDPTSYPVHMDWTDPETGVRWISLPLAEPGTYSEARRMPGVVEYDGDRFVRMSWNSDSLRVHYRNQTILAKAF